MADSCSLVMPLKTTGPNAPSSATTSPSAAVLRVGDAPCLVDDVLQHRPQLELARDGERRVPNRFEEQMKPVFVFVGGGIRDAEGENVRATVKGDALLGV